MKYAEKLSEKRGKGEFVITSRPSEKVCLDLIEFRKEGKYLLVGIDYFSRFINIQILENMDADHIVNTIKEWCNNGYIPEMLITDNGRELHNEKFKTFFKEMRIKHHLVGTEDHRANGRMERVIRTIRDGIFKLRDMEFEKKFETVVESYNDTYHIGTKCSPNEVLKGNSYSAGIEIQWRDPM